ncbi:hypothetical protein SAMN06295912_1504 [Sphingomonas laterariae]|uniref:Uncharacterized protein n=1 Tax=Edaphosphingomonas laterariae TaxID=861865 RepID=A0A239KDD2_9SPHN|nr:hypothetical protein [Sphingomonas laterariae]SNT15663.1 hypothetical protein SAMN06295912_1504 [Sphingomonas laterariae]
MPKLVLNRSIEDAILEEVSDGIPLAEACRKHGVGRTTIYDRRDADKEFAERLARARELGEDAILEETLDIADDATNDWMMRTGRDDEHDEQGVGWRLNGEHVQRSKLRVETRLKLLAVWNPKKFGSKVDVTSGGEQIKSADDISTMTRLASLAASLQGRIDEPSDDAE